MGCFGLFIVYNILSVIVDTVSELLNGLSYIFIDENLPDLSRIPDLLFVRFFFLDMVTVTLAIS